MWIMKKQFVPLFFLFVIVLILAFPLEARADGIIIPDPPICDPGPCLPGPIPIEQLEIRYHHVTVTIQDQVAAKTLPEC